MPTIGQYLAPSGHHLPVLRHGRPDIFAMYALAAEGVAWKSQSWWYATTDREAPRL